MDKEKFNLLTIWARLQSETPRFWKKLRQWMIGCGVVGAAIVAIPAEYTTWLYTWAPANIGGTMITIGAVGTALASLTKKP